MDTDIGVNHKRRCVTYLVWFFSPANKVSGSATIGMVLNFSRARIPTTSWPARRMHQKGDITWAGDDFLFLLFFLPSGIRPESVAPCGWSSGARETPDDYYPRTVISVYNINLIWHEIFGDIILSMKQIADWLVLNVTFNFFYSKMDINILLVS